jgi:hydrogenase 3 maturation protease
VVGIGSELNGDDAAGIHVARELARAAGIPANFLALDGGSIPENASGPLRKFKPDLVILVDAADMGVEPGTVAWLEVDQIDGMSASSHTLPLSVLGGYLESEIGCGVHYLGIQPARLDFAAELTPPVKAAVREIVATIKQTFL